LIYWYIDILIYWHLHIFTLSDIFIFLYFYILYFYIFIFLYFDIFIFLYFDILIFWYFDILIFWYWQINKLTCWWIDSLAPPWYFDSVELMRAWISRRCNFSDHELFVITKLWLFNTNPIHPLMRNIGLDVSGNCNLRSISDDYFGFMLSCFLWYHPFNPSLFTDYPSKNFMNTL
jgi:hypothetical protein